MNENANPEMLILARQIRGLTQSTLAELSGVDQGTISKYEGGLASMQDHDIQVLATALDFPPQFFFRAGMQVGTESGEVFHRKQRSLPAKQLRQIHAHLNLFRMDMEILLKGIRIASPYEIPQYKVREFDGDIDMIAELVRAAWKISPGPIPNMMKALEDASCIILKHDFQTNQIDETVQWIEPLPPVILVNDRSPGDRLRFTLAHMLGHLVLHHDDIPYSEMEDEADRFAAAFLMPVQDIEPELEPVTIEHLLQLKPTWKVSMQALIRRARDIGVIDSRRYRSLFQMLSRAGYRKIEPFPIPVEEPQLLRKLLHGYQQSGKDIDAVANLVSYFKDDFINWRLTKV